MQLVHRDVSPPNLFVTYDGEIKVLDFGVAKSKRSLVHTQAGVLKGKVAYMAPELVAGEEVDARADLYAIGVMLWEATAGRDRWPNMNEMAILSAVAGQARPELPGAVSRGLPPLADEICARALARRPEARYQSAAELRSDLVRLCEALGGRPTQQELQGYMAQRFTRQREREEREIERALHAQRPSLEVGPSEQDGFAGTKRVARPAAKAISEPDVSRTEPWNESPEAQPASPRTSRAGVVALGVVVLGAGALAALALGTRSDRQTGSALPEAMPTSAAVAAIRAESAAPAASSPSAAPSASHGAQLPRSTGGAPSTSAAPPSSPRKGSPAIAKTKPKGSTPPTSKQLELDRQNPWQ
jgi:serine/threonine-protein kinase